MIALANEDFNISGNARSWFDSGRAIGQEEGAKEERERMIKLIDRNIEKLNDGLEAVKAQKLDNETAAGIADIKMRMEVLLNIRKEVEK